MTLWMDGSPSKVQYSTREAANTTIYFSAIQYIMSFSLYLYFSPLNFSMSRIVKSNQQNQESEIPWEADIQSVSGR